MRMCAAESTVVKPSLTRLALLVALIIGTTPAAPALAAPADTTAPVVIPTGCWRLVVTPDEAAVNAGRYQFEEFVMIESTTDITAQEMSRLGFSPAKGSGAKNVAGQTTFTVVLKSNCHGTATWSGAFVSSSLVEGTLSWVKDGMTYNYTFTGTLFTPPADVES